MSTRAPKSDRNARLQEQARVICAVFVALFCLGVALPARADQDVRRVDYLLSSWDMAGAKKIIDKMTAAHPGTPDVLYVHARYDFLDGKYSRALEEIQQALTNSSGHPRWRRMRNLIANTREVTKNYTRHLSPKGYFAVYTAPGEDQVLLPYMFTALDKAYGVLGKLLGYYPPTPIRVEVYPRTATLAKVSILTDKEIRTSGTIALCKYNRLMITSPKALLFGYSWVDTVVHEYVHYIVNSKTHNRVPIWMHEGFAKYLERRWRGPNASMLPPYNERLLKKHFEAHKLITFAQMSPSMAKLPSQEDAAVAFGEVFSVMEFLEHTVGHTVFRQVLDYIVQGVPARQAMGKVLGTNFAGFRKQWMAYLRKRENAKHFPPQLQHGNKLVFKGDPLSKASFKLNKISEPRARDYVHLGQLLQARNRYQAAIVEYRKAIHLIGTYNPVLQTRLAQCLMKQGKPGLAVQALQPIKNLYPTYPTSWLELGRANEALQHEKAALHDLLESIELNPFDPAVHTELSKVYDQLGDADLAQRERKFAQIVE